MTDVLAKSKKRSGMSGDRSYRIQSKAKMRLDDIFSHARHFYYKHEDITKRVLSSEVLNLPEGTPQYVHSYLRGRWEVLSDELYRHHIMYVFSIDGVLMTKEERVQLTLTEMNELRRKFCLSEGDREEKWVPKDYLSPIRRINNDKCCYVYIDRDGKPLFNKKYS